LVVEDGHSSPSHLPGPLGPRASVTFPCYSFRQQQTSTGFIEDQHLCSQSRCVTRFPARGLQMSGIDLTISLRAPKSGACFGACSHSTLLPFSATCCKIETACRRFILCILCEGVLQRAACCNIAGFGLKTRRRQTPWGFNSPSRHHLSHLFTIVCEQ
jgi:hypothetical protein